MSTTAPPARSPLPDSTEQLGEQAWIEVIQKMDEVYNDLLQYEVALEEKNAALEESHQFIESVLTSMSDILIVCDRHGSIEEVNSSLCHFAGKTSEELLHKPLFDLFADEAERAKARELFSRFAREGVHDCELFLRAGEVKKDYADLLRRADAIFIEELRKTVDEKTGKNWYDLTSQAFAVFLPVKSVGVMGDGRTYEYVVALRAVQTQDFMTAHWAHLPYELLGNVSNRIINEVRGINRVVYDVSGKPPATIEWE